jgi:CopG family nickel-responsive transcriptional regulator
MKNLGRVSVSIEKELLAAFDAYVSREGYPTRSEAVAHLMTKAILEKEWRGKGRVAGAILMVYDHHKRDVVRKLLNVQHDYGEIIVSTQHVHLDHDNCLEMVTVKGKAPRIRKLVGAIKALKGMKHSALLMTTAGGHPS